VSCPGPDPSTASPNADQTAQVRIDDQEITLSLACPDQHQRAHYGQWRASGQADEVSGLTRYGIRLAVPGVIRGWVSVNLATAPRLGSGCLIEVGLLGVSSH
jgi:hypothetical protein